MYEHLELTYSQSDASSGASGQETSNTNSNPTSGGGEQDSSSTTDNNPVDTSSNLGNSNAHTHEDGHDHDNAFTTSIFAALGISLAFLF